MKKYIFSILFCFANVGFMVSANSIKSTSTDPIKKIVREIAKSDVYELSDSLSPSQQNMRYKELLNNATVEALTELTMKNKNAVVRLYAFRALVEKQKNIPKYVIDKIANDTTLVTTISKETNNKVPFNSIAKGFLY